MLLLCLILIALSFCLAVPLTFFVRSLGRRLNTLDAPGVPGQIKAPSRKVPNIGGVAIFWAFSLPILAALLIPHSHSLSQHLLHLFPAIEPHLPGARAMSISAAVILAAAALLHTLGLIDDRKPLPALPKLLFMFLLAALVAHFTDSRLLTALDPHVGGSWLSLLLSILWIVAVTNAFNFMDNMDGLSAGAGLICSAFFMLAALTNPTPQWFIAAALALLIGSLAGFLLFNFPFRSQSPQRPNSSKPAGATIFMGDSGSLVLGFLIAIFSLRITYIPLPVSTPDSSSLSSFFSSASFPSFFTPLVILAIPLYDFVSVCVIRLSQGKSPFVGDLQHFSHRLVNHGLSRRGAVLVILGCTAATGIGGIALASLKPWQALLVGAQTLLILLVLAAYEWARMPNVPKTSNHDAA